MSKKQPNQLASLIDHQAFAGALLPKNLNDTLKLYSQATLELKAILAEVLPEDILNSCQVVGLTAEQLTLSVSSTTAANHIRYLQSAYLQELSSQSLTFQQLKALRIMVTQYEGKTPLSYEQSVVFGGQKNLDKANENQALSQNTKRTIAQAAKHVTTDKKLQNALLRLIDDEKS